MSMVDIFYPHMYPAQMDMSKSTGYRAVEELLKAQSTQAALRRQFEEARLSEITLVQREVRHKTLGRVLPCCR